MPLKPIQLNKQEFQFRDGQKVEIYEPTLYQIQKAMKAGDDVAQIKSLLLDCSVGELDEPFLNALPLEEFEKLAQVVAKFRGVDEKN
ncbi:hypothetical protein NHP190012_11520 [Helicobacter sp. NHP19-012]|uniref:Phage tail assembly protein n=1 Tax=Helicobacter gastrofelis TaxID=2849642 RepID=A0ABN6ICZ2_9HELI|nr:MULTISPECIES: hypothetical protein [unclassified Helicobacter]BCZ19510.1 hypothetical protein NHP190012_11520 [Helicobacter sp. NHP19-012]GMB96845.1 hypothetical protein NHP22001_14340 [Helicobacter sp. NHP22-001]